MSTYRRSPECGTKGAVHVMGCSLRLQGQFKLTAILTDRHWLCLLMLNEKNICLITWHTNHRIYGLGMLFDFMERRCQTNARGMFA